jgi:hypothetical protein
VVTRWSTEDSVGVGSREVVTSNDFDFDVGGRIVCCPTLSAHRPSGSASVPRRSVTLVVSSTIDCCYKPSQLCYRSQLHLCCAAQLQCQVNESLTRPVWRRAWPEQRAIDFSLIKLFKPYGYKLSHNFLRLCAHSSRCALNVILEANFSSTSQMMSLEPCTVLPNSATNCGAP